MPNKDQINSLNNGSHGYSKSNIFTVPCYEEQDLLETTTMADVIRAIELLNIDKVTSEDTRGKSKINSLQKRRATEHFIRNHELLLLNHRHSFTNSIHSNASPLLTHSRKRIQSCVAENFFKNNKTGRASDIDPTHFNSQFQNPLVISSTHRFSIRPVKLSN